MSETENAVTTGDKTLPMVVYVLYLVSLLVGGIPAVIGMIMAYVNQSSGPAWHYSHYRFQIRTFWISLLYAVIGGLTVQVGIGVLILLWLLVWFVIRCVKGMMYLNQGRSHPDPASWLFG